MNARESFQIITLGKGSPKIMFVTGIHGDEQIFAELKSLIKKTTLLKGTISLVFAHPLAAKKKVRFIERDLNRSFPGSESGTLEERIAHSLTKISQGVDCLIDFHSFHFDSPPFTVLTDDIPQRIELAKVLGLNKNVTMPGRGKSFVEQVRLGIGVELGVVGDPLRIQVAKKVIINILSFYGMIQDSSVRNLKQKFYLASEKTVVTNSFVLDPKIKNFKLVKKGSVIGKNEDGEVYAQSSFYPILLKTNGYGETLCRNGKKKTSTI